MKWIITLCIVCLVAQQSIAPPVIQNEEDEVNKEPEVADEALNEDIEYHRYLREVVDALESDPVFREQLQNANESDIKTGKIADHLQHVNHNVRTKLDEIKRNELNRLKQLIMKKNELENEIDPDHKEHVDHTNPHTFEVEDLKKLIHKTTKDLAEADRKRREEFKRYEMKKHYEEEEKLKALKDEEARKQYLTEIEEMKMKNKKHQPLHHPGSKQQLEEVWEKQDHMDGQQFNPKLFFDMHDSDGNLFWDQNEVKALFKKELDKLYSDPVEKAEEMERMREHMFKEFDLDRNGVIDYQEFLTLSNAPSFQQDSGWQAVNEQQEYTPEEYEAFQRQMQEQLSQQMYPSPHADPNQHYYPGQVPPAHMQYPGHPEPQYQGQVPMHHQGQVPVQHQYQGQVPPQQYQPAMQHQQQYQPPVHQPVHQPVQQQQYQGPPQYVPRDQIPPEHHQYPAQPVQPKPSAQSNVSQEKNTHPQVNNEVNSPVEPVKNHQNPPPQSHDANHIPAYQPAPQPNSLHNVQHPAVPQTVKV